MLEELDHDCRENDSGVSIRDNYKIKELFHESIVEFLQNLKKSFGLEMILKYNVNMLGKEITESYFQ